MHVHTGVSMCALVSAYVHLCQHTADVQQSNTPLGCADS